MVETAFWRRKSLEEMTDAEWESLCDGCGQCCLIRLVDDKSGEIGVTNVACRLFNTKTGRCRDYRRRTKKVKGCVKLTPELARTTEWLPQSCAYRLLAHGHDLPDWHPLITGRTDSVKQAGYAVAGLVLSETEIEIEDEADLWDFLVE